MDFHSLTRKELQALCKKNKIPANITNLAMADSLAALQHVEGIEELLNQSQSDEIEIIGSPNVPRTVCRTSRRRNPAAMEDLENSKQPLTRTRGGTRRALAEEEGRSDEVPPETPVVSSCHGRRAPQVSVSKRAEFGSVQRAYSTRRSVRLLEMGLESLSLKEDVKIQPMKIDEVFEEVIVDSLEKFGCSSKKVFSSEMNKKELNDRVSEEEDSKSESELVDLVETSDEKTDVEEESETVPIAKISNETQNSNSKEILDEVSSGDIEQDIAHETCSARKEEREKSVETITLNPSSDHTVESKTELEPEDSLNLASEGKSNDIIAPETCSAKQEEGKKPAEAITLNPISAELESEDSLDLASEGKSNDVETEIPHFESEAMKPLAEILADDYTGADKAVESETEDMDINESSDEEEEEYTDDSESEEESYSEASLDDDDVNVEISQPNEAVLETSMVVQSNESNPKDVESEEEYTDDSESEEESDSDASLVDDGANVEIFQPNEAVLQTSIVVQSKENNQEDIESEESDSEASLETPLAVEPEEKNNNNPIQSLPMSPFAADQISGQFPRPSLPTPNKPSSKKSCPVVETDDESEEDNEASKDENCLNGEKDNLGAKQLEEKSLRELQKMLKIKLQIENNKKAEKKRVALQALPENRLAVDEHVE